MTFGYGNKPMNIMTRFSINEVNNISEDEFENVFGNVIELYNKAAKGVQSKRPFRSKEELIKAFHEYMDQLNNEEKEVILKLHPDLAGRMADQGQLTAESASEQSSAGLNNLTKEQKQIINIDNNKYKSKFGFPFIICARENKVQSIMDGLKERYKNTKDEEIQTAINEVKKICRLRILDIVT